MQEQGTRGKRDKGRKTKSIKMCIRDRECAMQTTVTENELDLSELDAMLQEAENQVAVLQSQINAWENENADRLKKIAEASVEDAAV